MVSELHTRHFVYQRVHASGGRTLHLAKHLTLAARVFEQIYGVRPSLDERGIAGRIASLLKESRVPAHAGATVMLYLVPTDEGGCEIVAEFERVLLDAGYAHSPLRPTAVTFEYSLPFGGLPTGFQLAARALFDSLALSRHGTTRSVRREGESLLSCGDSPIFALRGRALFVPPLSRGAVESVERQLVMEAAERAGFVVREEPISHSQLKSFDELFFADATGITSLSECDGAKFMTFAVARIVAALAGAPTAV